MSTIAPNRRSSPVAVTRSWRLEQLIAAGYPFRDARAVSVRTDVDLHLAVRLLRQGCPLETALRILL
jgi:hypothetical protein